MNTFLVPCPVVEMPESEYGIEYQYDAQTLQVCSDSSIESMQQLFKTRKEAEAFVEKGKSLCRDSFRCSITNWRILPYDTNE